MKVVFQPSIFRGYVSFREGKKPIHEQKEVVFFSVSPLKTNISPENWRLKWWKFLLKWFLLKEDMWIILFFRGYLTLGGCQSEEFFLRHWSIWQLELILGELTNFFIFLVGCCGCFWGKPMPSLQQTCIFDVCDLGSLVNLQFSRIRT